MGQGICLVDMELNFHLDNWQSKMLEAFYGNPNEHFKTMISDIIKNHKNVCIDRYIDYCKSNDLPISYDSDDELIEKMYEFGLLTNLDILNKQFLENH